MFEWEGCGAVECSLCCLGCGCCGDCGGDSGAHDPAALAAFALHSVRCVHHPCMHQHRQRRRHSHPPPRSHPCHIAPPAHARAGAAVGLSAFQRELRAFFSSIWLQKPSSNYGAMTATTNLGRVKKNKPRPFGSRHSAT